MRAPVLCLVSLLVFTLAACGGDAATDESDTVSDAPVTAQTDAQSEGDAVSGPDGDWCVTSDQCAEEGHICTTEFGDCQACQGELEICCGVCEPSPCQDKACGESCDCPPGVECTEEPKACNASGQCVAAVLDLECEEPAPHDACDGLLCGDECNPCAPGDSDCAQRPGLPHHCDADGVCSNNEVETLGCTVTCVGTGECGEGEICTTAYGHCSTCAGEAGADPVCCGTCEADPCAGMACGAGCFFCASGAECPELPMECNAEGMCVVVSSDPGCEEPPPYDACAGLACGMSCNPCAPGDEECAMQPSLPHYCDAEGVCSNNEPDTLGCSESCVASNECGEAQVCTTEFGDCQTCEGAGGADPVCCGTCVENPCNGKACGEGCACPDGVGCPEVPFACDETGSCVTADKPSCEEDPADLCKDQPCGTPCGDDQICDTDGACIVSPNMPIEEFCAGEMSGCMSSDDCELGEYCTVSDGACEACSEGSMLTVCCGTCEPFDPCKDKACGTICGPCPSDQQDCFAPEVEMFCNNEGQCSEEQSACDM